MNSSAFDDLLGNLGKKGAESRRESPKVEKDSPAFDDLLPGFGRSSSPRVRSTSESSRPTRPTTSSVKTAPTSIDDPFVVLESTSTPAAAPSESFPDPLDEIGRFNSSGSTNVDSSHVHKGSFDDFDPLDNLSKSVPSASSKVNERARVNQQKYESQPENENDLESFFSSRPSSAPRPRATSSIDVLCLKMQDPFFDTGAKRAPEPPKNTSANSSASMRKASSATNIVDDLSSIFGGGQSGEFQDIAGETEERRRARLERHQRTQERAAKALAEKNQRDLNAQMEQEERHRIAETLDFEIKRWSAGKEGNLRALLSTMQYVLWPECGWQPVSLTDLITAASVKKAYRKATLCIHPDKVQQKGANLQQKYIAEKVFDLLKEAWNKFNSEELF
ncbi:Auxilin-related protein 2 [Linum perenne]